MEETAETRDVRCKTCGDRRVLTSWGQPIGEDEEALVAHLPTIACPDCPPEEEEGPEDFLAQVTPDYSADEVLARIGEAWTLVDARFPVPRFQPACPCCRSEDVGLRQVAFQMHPYRADVAFACYRCALAWTHAVPIPAVVYERGVVGGRHVWGWREIVDREGKD